MTNATRDASLAAAAKLGLPPDLFIAQHTTHGVCIVSKHTVAIHKDGYSCHLGLHLDAAGVVNLWHPSINDLTPVVAAELPDWIMLKRHNRYGIVAASVNTDFHPPLEDTTEHDCHIAFVVNGLYKPTRRPYVMTFEPKELHDI
ncbi:hypothetical protein N24_1802 [Corynebacterium suranareeae]|uniref:Uncharacterized protein n=1 Tax=Corynebacterium suranareeae TaxID=2506452 RepID=A0A160PR32_9CORY|nr:hypothetical protein [Corynebacterium suranareeae]BAU96064.1 hypothetical protein N24_1802 [Corynebacterium suranareeae]